VKLANWLLFCCAELNKITGLQSLNKDINRTRTRLRYGAKEELLPLLRLEGIGRVRARKLFANKVKDIGDVKKAQLITLQQLLGRNLGIKVKQQVGEIVKEIPKATRKGQLSLGKYGDVK